MKIIFLLLNDDFTDIRNKACQIFMKFNNLIKLFEVKFKISMTLTNYYLTNKILRKCDLNNETHIKFLAYIFKNNFYFKENTYETKVFYFEPDNTYIDNSLNKMLILKNILKNNTNCIKLIEELKKEELKTNLNNEKNVFIVFEEFTELIKEKCWELKEKNIDNKNAIDKDKLKFMFKDVIRPGIY